MVGNDSGPKHLAATRGVPTVSVHIDRLNWNEWGQHGTGTILSKRVPCTGCVLNDVQLCGREAVCVRSITVEEVWQAVRTNVRDLGVNQGLGRSEEHTSELQSLMRISYAVFCLKKNKYTTINKKQNTSLHNKENIGKGSDEQIDYYNV